MRPNKQDVTSFTRSDVHSHSCRHLLRSTFVPGQTLWLCCTGWPSQHCSTHRSRPKSRRPLRKEMRFIKCLRTSTFAPRAPKRNNAQHRSEYPDHACEKLLSLGVTAVFKTLQAIVEACIWIMRVLIRGSSSIPLAPTTWLFRPLSHKLAGCYSSEGRGEDFQITPVELPLTACRLWRAYFAEGDCTRWRRGRGGRRGSSNIHLGT